MDSKLFRIKLFFFYQERQTNDFTPRRKQIIL